MDPHLLTLLLQLMSDEDHVDGPVMTAEAAPTFRQETLFQMVLETVEEDADEDLFSNVDQRDASVVVPDLAVIFQHREMDGCGVLKIMRDFSSTPHLMEECHQMIHELRATVLIDLSWTRI
nr:unnamed protein product [Spirometra erinaceieuropaei]